MHSQYDYLLASLKHPGEWLTCTTISNLSWTNSTSLWWTNSRLSRTSTRPTPSALSVAISSGCHDNTFYDVIVTDNARARVTGPWFMIHVPLHYTIGVWNVVVSRGQPLFRTVGNPFPRCGIGSGHTRLGMWYQVGPREWAAGRPIWCDIGGPKFQNFPHLVLIISCLAGMCL